MSDLVLSELLRVRDEIENNIINNYNKLKKQFKYVIIISIFIMIELKYQIIEVILLTKKIL